MKDLNLPLTLIDWHIAYSEQVSGGEGESENIDFQEFKDIPHIQDGGSLPSSLKKLV
jgi:hypothetical protein